MESVTDHTRPQLAVVDIDGAHPVRSVFRLLGAHRRRVLAAVAFFTLKDIPLWFLPVITARIIDIVVDGGPAERAVAVGRGRGGRAAAELPEPHPVHASFMSVVRDIGADLRNGAHRPAAEPVDRLPHARERVDRADQGGARRRERRAHAPAGHAPAAVGDDGDDSARSSMTAIAVPQFLPVYALTVPIAMLLRVRHARRSRERNETFRREVEALLRPRRRDGVAHADHPRARPRGDRRGRASPYGAEGVRSAGLPPRHAQRPGRLVSLGQPCSCSASLCLVLAAWVSHHRHSPDHARRGRAAQRPTSRCSPARLTGLLMLLPVGARGLESVRSIAEVMQEPDLEENDGKRRVDHVEGRLTPRARRTSATPTPTPTRSHDIDLDIEAGETVAFVGPVRLRQVDAAQPRARLRAAHRRPAPARRRRHARPRPAHRPPARLGRAAGVRAVRGLDPRQHRLRHAARCPTSACGQALRRRERARDRRRPAPTAGTPSSASAARGCRAVSASGSRSPARSCATRASCCSTRRPPRWTPSPRQLVKEALGPADARAHHARRRAPAVDDPLRRPHRRARRRPRRRGGHATTSCSPRRPLRPAAARPAGVTLSARTPRCGR